MLKYGWRLTANVDGEETGTESKSSLSDFAPDDVVSAILAEPFKEDQVTGDVAVAAVVKLELSATRTEGEQTLYAKLVNGELPTWFEKDARNNGPFVHRDLHDELEMFKVVHRAKLEAAAVAPVAIA